MAYQVQENRFGERDLPPEEAAYIAGLMDGEGSLYLVARKAEGRRSHHFNPEMTLSNRSLVVLEWLVDKTANGAIYQSHKPKANHQPVYRWQLQPSQIRYVLPQILPYLFIKKPQAELLLEFFDLQKLADRGPWGYAKPEVIDRILDIYAELRSLNLRGLTVEDKLEFSMREGKPRKRTCDQEGCENRRYRGHDVCYQHWLETAEPIPKVCEECNKPFNAILAKARFCTPKCQWKNAARRRCAERSSA